MEISVKADLKEVTRYLNRVQKQQLPFATALALTKTAQQAAKATQAQLHKKLDRPKPFTVKGVTWKKATKKRLVSSVLFKATTAAYLKYVLEGGTKKGKGRGVIVPTRALKRDPYGGIPAKRKKAPLWQEGKTTSPHQFIGTVKGIHGLWERTNPTARRQYNTKAGNKGSRRRAGVRLLMAFEKKVSYKPGGMFPFKKIVGGVVRNRFKRNFDISLAQALRTAR